MRRLVFNGMPPHAEMLKEKKITELCKDNYKMKKEKEERKYEKD